MDAIILILLTIVVFALVGLGFLLFSLLQKMQSLTATLKGEEILRTLHTQKGELGAGLRTLEDGLRQVTSEMGGIGEVSRQIREFQESLRATKLRGNIGEVVMVDLLRQIYPPELIHSQYTFKTTRKTVDAVIETSQGLVPIDAKFPLEKFQAIGNAEEESEKERHWKEFSRSVKERMDETAAYIVPEEGTIPFALMYIPYDEIFNQVTADPDLWHYALEKKVYFTSPQSLWVIVQSLLVGLRRERFTEQAEEVLEMLHAVSRDAENLDGVLATLARHINDAKNTTDKLSTGFSAFLGKLAQLKDFKVESKRGGGKR
jgi:DNA recombination protein RmuC